jgi:hypothetical protein
MLHDVTYSMFHLYFGTDSIMVNVHTKINVNHYACPADFLRQDKPVGEEEEM